MRICLRRNPLLSHHLPKSRARNSSVGKQVQARLSASHTHQDRVQCSSSRNTANAHKQPWFKQQLHQEERIPGQIMANPTSSTQQQPHPGNTPAGSFFHTYQLRRSFSPLSPDKVLQAQTFPFQTHLARDKLNFLDPPSQTRAEEPLLFQ